MVWYMYKDRRLVVHLVLFILCLSTAENSSTKPSMKSSIPPTRKGPQSTTTSTTPSPTNSPITTSTPSTNSTTIIFPSTKTATQASTNIPTTIPLTPTTTPTIMASSEIATSTLQATTTQSARPTSAIATRTAMPESPSTVSPTATTTLTSASPNVDLMLLSSGCAVLGEEFKITATLSNPRFFDWLHGFQCIFRFAIVNGLDCDIFFIDAVYNTSRYTCICDPVKNIYSLTYHEVTTGDIGVNWTVVAGDYFSDRNASIAIQECSGIPLSTSTTIQTTTTSSIKTMTLPTTITKMSASKSQTTTLTPMTTPTIMASSEITTSTLPATTTQSARPTSAIATRTATPTSPSTASSTTTTTLTSTSPNGDLMLLSSGCAVLGEEFKITAILSNPWFIDWRHGLHYSFGFTIVNGLGCNIYFKDAVYNTSRFTCICDPVKNIYSLTYHEVTTEDIGVNWTVVARGSVLDKNASIAIQQCSDCGIPNTPAKGYAVYNNTSINSTANYFCYSGYDLVGENETTCLRNGSWNDNVPLCEILDSSSTKPLNSSKSPTRKTTSTTPSSTNSPKTTSTPSTNSTPITLPSTTTLTQTSTDIPTTTTLIENATAPTTTQTPSPNNSQIITSSSSIMASSEITTSTLTATTTKPAKPTQSNAITITTPTSKATASSTTTTTPTSIATSTTTTSPTSTATSTATSSSTTTTTLTSANCNVPTAPENGKAEFNYTEINSTVMYRCNVGYQLVGENASICLNNGSWDSPMPSCVMRDCGCPPSIQNGSFELIGGTKFSSVAIYTCDDGLKLNTSSGKKVCDENGVWTGNVGQCVPTVCKQLSEPLNGDLKYSPDNKTAYFTCSKGFILNGRDVLFCQLDGFWNGQEPICKTKPETIKMCEREVDYQGTSWNDTYAGQSINFPCKGPEEEGSISRVCSEDSTWRRPVYLCVKKEISQAEAKISAIENLNVTDDIKSATVTDVLETLSNSTKESTESDKSALYDGEIEKMTSILEKVARISKDIPVSEHQSKAFILTTSSLLDPKNIESYRSLDEGKANQTGPPSSGAGKVLEVVGAFTKAIANSLDKFNGSTTINSLNMVVTVEEINASSKEVNFPNKLNLSSDASAGIQLDYLEGIESYSGIYYKNLSGMLTSTIYDNGILNTELYEINTGVIDINLMNKSASQDTFLIDLHFEHFIDGDFDRKCAFWNFSRNTWDTSGCQINEGFSNETFTVCSCDHLTNFAILMNPYKTENVNSKVLDYISLIGCSISIVCLLINCVMHGLLWRYLKSDRAVILMNLSIALIISYVLFIAGVDRTEYKELCTTIAVSLHYIYLVVFLLMLAEGVEILITVVYVLVMQSRRKWLLMLSWGLPLIIVGVAIGVSKTDGYGSKEFCWLSVNDGLIWAFVGPAITIIVINFIILFVVMKTMFTAKTLKRKKLVEQVKTGVRCLFVLLPLTGGTWVIGVFYVNERLEWIQYLFAVINSLQGASILICHCIMNSQMKIAISRRLRRYRASSSMTQSRSADFSIPRPTKTTGMYNNLFESSTDSYEDSGNIPDDMECMPVGHQVNWKNLGTPGQDTELQTFDNNAHLQDYFIFKID